MKAHSILCRLNRDNGVSQKGEVLIKIKTKITAIKTKIQKTYAIAKISLLDKADYLQKGQNFKYKQILLCLISTNIIVSILYYRYSNMA